MRILANTLAKSADLICQKVPRPGWEEAVRTAQRLLGACAVRSLHDALQLNPLWAVLAELGPALWRFAVVHSSPPKNNL